MLTAATCTYIVYWGCFIYIIRKWDHEINFPECSKPPVEVEIPIIEKHYLIIDASTIPMELLPFHHLGITTLPDTIIALNALGYY